MNAQVKSLCMRGGVLVYVRMCVCVRVCVLLMRRWRHVLCEGSRSSWYRATC